MKKHIILSVNSNEDYLYHVPLTCWAWQKFGWYPILMYQMSDSSPLTQALEALISSTPATFTVRKVKSIEGYRSDTITQISRLYASAFFADPQRESYLMTGDIDMVPLSDYWNPDPKDITVWGHDLTGFTHYPICYIGMMEEKWHEVMQIDGTDYDKFIKRDLDTLPQAKEEDFYKRWFTDQDLITDRLKSVDKALINRGQGHHGFAYGRVDRGAGGWVLDQPELIDAHMPQQAHHNLYKISMTRELIHSVWPNEDFTWWEDYTNKFRELTGKK
jgi:hypothetical protein